VTVPEDALMELGRARNDERGFAWSAVAGELSVSLSRCKE
jgi:hypothetical protein